MYTTCRSCLFHKSDSEFQKKDRLCDHCRTKKRNFVPFADNGHPKEPKPNAK